MVLGILKLHPLVQLCLLRLFCLGHLLLSTLGYYNIEPFPSEAFPASKLVVEVPPLVLQLLHCVVGRYPSPTVELQEELPACVRGLAYPQHVVHLLPLRKVVVKQPCSWRKRLFPLPSSHRFVLQLIRHNSW